MWQDLLNRFRADKRRSALIGVGGIVLVIAVILLVRGNNKQRVLASSLEHLRDASSYHTSAKLDIRLPNLIGSNRQRPIVDVSFAVDGDIQVQENGQPVFFGKMRNDARGRGMTLFADGELALLPDKVAFRLENLPALLNPKGNLVEKWTYVDVPALETKNTADVRSVLEGLVQKAEFVGNEQIEDAKMYHYRVTLTPDEESVLIEAFRQTNSGNRSLHIVTRLLRAFEAKSIDMWVDPGSKELRKLAAIFAQPLEGGSTEDRAQLSLEFSDYGKEVAIQEPPRELSVRPEVFGRMFGTGDIAGIGQNN